MAIHARIFPQSRGMAAQKDSQKTMSKNTIDTNALSQTANLADFIAMLLDGYKVTEAEAADIQSMAAQRCPKSWEPLAVKDSYGRDDGASFPFQVSVLDTETDRAFVQSALEKACRDWIGQPARAGELKDWPTDGRTFESLTALAQAIGRTAERDTVAAKAHRAKVEALLADWLADEDLRELGEERLRAKAEKAVTSAEQKEAELKAARKRAPKNG